MKKKIILIVFLCFFFLTLSSCPNAAGLDLGVITEKNYTDGSIWYGGYLRTGRLFKLEFSGLRPLEDESDPRKIKLFSYLLVNLKLSSIGGESGSLNLYFGSSPAMSLDPQASAFSISRSSAYGKAGLKLRFFPFSISTEINGEFNFSGRLKQASGGLAVGLSF